MLGAGTFRTMVHHCEICFTVTVEIPDRGRDRGAPTRRVARWYGKGRIHDACRPKTKRVYDRRSHTALSSVPHLMLQEGEVSILGCSPNHLCTALSPSYSQCSSLSNLADDISSQFQKRKDKEYTQERADDGLRHAPLLIFPNSQFFSSCTKGKAQNRGADSGALFLSSVSTSQ